MRLKKFIATVATVSIVFALAATYAFATGFTMEEPAPEDLTTFKSNLDVAPSNREIKKRGIDCFDVSESGLIAVGFDGLNEKQINVYDIDGNYQYGYTFSSTGSFCLEFSGDDLYIYFVRGGIAALFDKDANLLDVKQIQDTIDNNSYWYKVQATTKTSGGYTFHMYNKGLAGFMDTSYTRLSRIDGNKSETLLYDAGASYGIGHFAIILFFVSLFVIVFVRIIKGIGKNTTPDDSK